MPNALEATQVYRQLTSVEIATEVISSSHFSLQKNHELESLFSEKWADIDRLKQFIPF